MAKGKFRRLPPTAAAEGAQNRRRKEFIGRHIAPGVCAFVVILAVMLERSGWLHNDATAKADPRCADRDPRCPEWARLGECGHDPRRFIDLCRTSCDVCNASKLRRMQSMYDMGVEQVVDYDGDIGGMMYWRVKLMQEYYESEMISKARYTPEIRERCGNKNESCALWAAQGWCNGEKKAFMEKECAAMCRRCYKIVCPLEAGGPYVWGPGALNKMFTRIVSNDYFVERYQPKVHSRPAESATRDDGTSTDGPWVVTLENFATPEECDRLAALGFEIGYHQSQTRTINNVAGQEVSDLRTSSTAWCYGSCADDPVTMAVTARIVNLTGIPRPNQENLQLLKYEEGQHYGIHHDYIPEQRGRQTGVRILTVFLYLNDEGLEGGETNFPYLNNLTVHPKRGQVLIWPSVKNEAPNEKDERTDHQSLSVLRGVKFGANAWIHMRDFQGPKGRDCL